MKTNGLQSNLGAAILGLFLLCGIGVSFSTTAQAQYPSDRGARDRRDRDRDQDRDRDRDQDRDRDRNQDNDRGWRRRGHSGDGYRNYGGSFQLRQTALNAGYNEGIKEGRNDRRKYRYHSFRDFSAYQKATKDYNSRDGDRELYRRYFREAFENGYDAGYNGY